MIRCCIFDLDGTLLNTLDDLAVSCNYALKLQGITPHAVDAYRGFVGDGIGKLIDRAAPSATREQKLAVKQAFNEHYAKHYMDCTAPYEGIEPMLQALKLKAIRFCVVTNKPHEFAVELIRHMFGDNCFEAVMGATDELSKKPSPEGVRKCMGKLFLNPHECVYIGDSDVDVMTAHNAGLKAIGAAWGFRGRQELVEAGADFIADAPMQILKLMH